MKKPWNRAHTVNWRSDMIRANRLTDRSGYILIRAGERMCKVFTGASKISAVIQHKDNQLSYREKRKNEKYVACWVKKK